MIVYFANHLMLENIFCYHLPTKNIIVVEVGPLFCVNCTSGTFLTSSQNENHVGMIWNGVFIHVGKTL